MTVSPLRVWHLSNFETPPSFSSCVALSIPSKALARAFRRFSKHTALYAIAGSCPAPEGLRLPRFVALSDSFPEAVQNN
ncbi:hypothetical protein GQ43DRAFT_440551 [Delitschia confertaspora ATCC 74209]|uniref:Uncharacterized protein n=1 Tax=Delitschia confertaspora ATCC 74209 TaxID=1513339 RepID=A0A9P4JNJ3_9PLEO|nr:hypothetical protein GQ43DRAFT_440551 [Delitschia confertaspora ATCC 74209]